MQNSKVGHLTCFYLTRPFDEEGAISLSHACFKSKTYLQGNTTAQYLEVQRATVCHRQLNNEL